MLAGIAADRPNAPPISSRSAPAREAHLRRVRGKIGMVFLHFNLFPHKSALGNCMEAPM